MGNELDEFDVSNKSENGIRLPFPIIGLAVCIGSLIVFGIVALMIMISYTSDKNAMQSYIVGEATKKGYIGVKITYDKEPVDVILCDPEGHKYRTDSQNVYYEIKDDEKTVVLLADSDVLGTWSVQFNTKSNKNINYCMIETPSETLYISDPSICIGEDGQYYLKMTTVLADGETTARCNMTLNKSAFSYGLKSSDIELNKEAYVLLQFPDHVFTDEDYHLKINISTKSGKTALSQVDVHLNARREQPSEINKENMPAEETTSAD